MTSKDIADDVEIALKSGLYRHHVVRMRAQDSLRTSDADDADVFLFEEYEDDELVGLHVVPKLLDSFDATRMFNGQIIQILAAEGLDMIEETLSVQIMGRAFGL